MGAARLGAARTGVLVVVLLCAAVGHLYGVRAVPVLTGSMAPSIPPGALVVTVPVPGGDLDPGDVVAFRPPPGSVTQERVVVHRVVELPVVQGRAAMRTRGDANAAPDGWLIDVDGGDIRRVVATVPQVGRLVAGGPAPALVAVLGAWLLLGLRPARRARKAAVDRRILARHRG